MRSKRLSKFGKKNRSLMIVLKISFIFYLLLFMAGYVMSSTTAYFSSGSQISQQITAGTWENDTGDESNLEFVNTGSSSDEDCSVTATLTNNSGSALEGTYTVYYAEEGVPKTDGEQIHQGTIDKPELKYDTSKPGVYQFVAERNNDGSNGQTVWSDSINAACETESDDKEEKSDEEEKDADGGKEDKEEENENADDEESPEETSNPTSDENDEKQNEKQSKT